MADRTAPFAALPLEPLSSISQDTGRIIRKDVTIPGLKKHDGGPVIVEVTYTLVEIGYDWVSVIMDHQYGTEPVVYGSHVNAVGPLRELLPDAFPLPAYPETRQEARNQVVSMLMGHDLGGWVLADSEYSTRNLRVELPARFGRLHGAGLEPEIRYYVACVTEYMPFRALVRWDGDNDCIRIGRKTDA